MGVVDDVRKALQDFLGPELRAVNARLDAVDSQFQAVNDRFDAVDARLKAMEQVIDARFSQILDRLNNIQLLSEFDKRRSQLESREPRA
jgi:uncharacterized protein YdcH (DUF465 family)